jgi:CHAD domain-containing protein
MKARKVDELDPAASLDRNAARIVRTRVEELRSFADDALSSNGAAAQHDMRIAAKRLRYLLEVLGFCFGEEAEAARASAKQLQDRLGEIHDCDVMLPRVQAEIERLGGDDGLELLAAHLQAQRALLFERFLGCWQRQYRQGTWARLERAAQAPFSGS